METGTRTDHVPQRLPALELPGAETRPQFRLSLGAWLALGLMAIMVVCLAGNVLVQRSTRLATQNAARVQEELEPLAHRARTLADAIGAFDRTVLTYPKPGSRQDRADIESARLTLQDPSPSTLSTCGLNSTSIHARTCPSCSISMSTSGSR